jgi:hypothetical protein
MCFISNTRYDRMCRKLCLQHVPAEGSREDHYDSCSTQCESSAMFVFSYLGMVLWLQTWRASFQMLAGWWQVSRRSVSNLVANAFCLCR